MPRLFPTSRFALQPNLTPLWVGLVVVVSLLWVPGSMGTAIAIAGVLFLVIVNNGSSGEELPLPESAKPTNELENEELRDQFDSALRSYLEIEERVEKQRRRLNGEVRTRTSGLLKKKHELERDHELRDEFVSLLTHELRTPLTSVRSYVELMLAYGDGISTDERNEFLGIVNSQVKRISRLVDELLDLSRIRSGKFEIVTEPCDVIEVIDRVVSTFGEVARADGKSLLVKANPSAHAIADPERLDQAIGNLLSNAIKYSDEGRTIEIRAESSDEQTISIEIIDQGPGIPADERELVFEAFYRAQSAGKSKIPGTGLGLHLSRELVRQMGGELKLADSPDGSGARFVIDLPSVGATEPVERPDRTEEVAD